MDALDRAIEILGSQAALARAIGLEPAAITNWKARGRVPPKQCAQIEIATNGAVTARELRPDLAGIFGTDTPPPARRRSGRAKQATA